MAENSKNHTTKICDATNLCDAMERAVDNGNGKGLHVVYTVNTEKKQFVMLGIKFKASAKDRGIMLNCCPWCRGEPGSFTRGA